MTKPGECLGGGPPHDLGGQPILALGMYEHAYHMDYGAKAGDYVEAFMRAIRWAHADSLFEHHSRA
jgi:Fe-Mn family superoxide dismutase